MITSPDKHIADCCAPRLREVLLVIVVRDDPHQEACTGLDEEPALSCVLVRREGIVWANERRVALMDVWIWPAPSLRPGRARHVENAGES